MNDKLDDILKDWGHRQEPSADALNKLTRRVTTEAARCRYERSYPVDVPLTARLRYAAVGATFAFAVTLLLCFFWAGQQRSAPCGSAAGSPAAMAALSPERIRAGKQLFSEMDRLFGDKLRWVAESNGDASVGVEPIPGGVSPDTTPLLVRLTVVSRNEGDDAWTTEWTTDLIVRGEERVEIAPNSDTGNRLALWVYPMHDGRLAVDTDVSLDLPIRLAGRTSTIAQQNCPQEIMHICEGPMEYRVLQTIQRLDGKDAIRDA